MAMEAKHKMETNPWEVKSLLSRLPSGCFVFTPLRERAKEALEDGK